MKRLALVLAAASLVGTGCIIHDNDDHRTVNPPPPPACTTQAVTLDWSGGFQDYTGAVLSCAQAGVTEVDVWVNGNFDSSYACTQGTARGTGLPAGTNVFTVEGIDASGRIAFRAEASVSGGNCSDQRVGVRPAEGLLALDYSFAPDNLCYGATLTYIWTSVRDEITGQVAFVDRSTYYACSTTEAAPTYLLPAGEYTLLGIEEVQLDPSVVRRAANCADVGFVIAGGAATTLTPVLDASVDVYAACF